MEDLTLANAVAAGGWDPRYARALAVATDGDVAAALIDTNGDGGSVDLDIYHRAVEGHWEAQSSSGGAGDSGTSVSPEMVTAYGRTAPGAEVFVDYGGRAHVVRANRQGWWLFVAVSIDDHTFPECRTSGW